MRPIILPWLVWLAVIAGSIGLVVYASNAHAEPLAEAKSGDVRVILFNEPCALDAIKNLPYRATWEEAGKVFEGCWGGRPDVGLALAYFEDRTVAAIPVSSLVRLRSL